MTRTNLVIALVLFALPAFAQHSESAKPSDDAGATPAAAKSAESKPAEPVKNPLPADKSAPQTITVSGKTLHYTATVGTIALKGKDDKPTGVVMYIAYTLDQPKGDEPRGKNNKDSDSGSHRPVTFALNGGPGASSVYLRQIIRSGTTGARTERDAQEDER